jgi:energy-converting hydrogenase Eha subunit B
VDGALTGIAPIRPLQLCADGGYQLRLGALGVPLIMVPDSIVQFSITIFAKIIQVFLRSIQAGLKRRFSSLRNMLWIINLRHHHPADKQRYKVKNNYKNQGKQQV